MPCNACPTKRIFARGLCAACYYRLRRRGTLERKNVRNTGRCSVDGCERASFAKNLCSHHYEKSLHPLAHTWRRLRSRYKGHYPVGWDRFETFLAEVGERPSPKHQLRRIDGNLPWGASNVRWLGPVNPGADHMSPTERSAYAREWTLRRKFNITGEQFDAMLAEQGGVCAICRNPETHKFASGRVKALSVDHDHASGMVRGLLCINCNQGIGRFQDDAARLRAAADYLDSHRPRGA